MTIRSTPKKGRFLVRLATASLVVSFLLPGYPGILSDDTSTQFHDEPVRAEYGTEIDDYAQEMVFFHEATEEDLVNIPADVVVDEEFVNFANDDWLVELQDTLDGANDVLSAVGVKVKIESVQKWQSDDNIYYISSHLKSAEEQVRRVPGHLFLALIGQHTVRHDGFALESGSRMIVQFYPKDRKRTHALIAHEVGHLLGVDHHEDEEECTGEGCIMDREGYAHAATWCEHHQNIIQENVDSNLAAQAS